MTIKEQLEKLKDIQEALKSLYLTIQRTCPHEKAMYHPRSCAEDDPSVYCSDCGMWFLNNRDPVYRKGYENYLALQRRAKGIQPFKGVRHSVDGALYELSPPFTREEEDLN